MPAVETAAHAERPPDGSPATAAEVDAAVSCCLSFLSFRGIRRRLAGHSRGEDAGESGGALSKELGSMFKDTNKSVDTMRLETECTIRDVAAASYALWRVASQVKRFDSKAAVRVDSPADRAPKGPDTAVLCNQQDALATADDRGNNMAHTPSTSLPSPHGDHPTPLHLQHELGRPDPGGPRDPPDADDSDASMPELLRIFWLMCKESGMEAYLQDDRMWEACSWRPGIGLGEDPLRSFDPALLLRMLNQLEAALLHSAANATVLMAQADIKMKHLKRVLADSNGIDADLIAGTLLSRRDKNLDRAAASIQAAVLEELGNVEALERSRSLQRRSRPSSRLHHRGGDDDSHRSGGRASPGSPSVNSGRLRGWFGGGGDSAASTPRSFLSRGSGWWGDHGDDPPGSRSPRSPRSPTHIRSMFSRMTSLVRRANPSSESTVPGHRRTHTAGGAAGDALRNMDASLASGGEVMGSTPSTTGGGHASTGVQYHSSGPVTGTSTGSNRFSGGKNFLSRFHDLRTTRNWNMPGGDSMATAGSTSANARGAGAQVTPPGRGGTYALEGDEDAGASITGGDLSPRSLPDHELFKKPDSGSGAGHFGFTYGRWPAAGLLGLVFHKRGSAKERRWAAMNATLGAMEDGGRDTTHGRDGAMTGRWDDSAGGGDRATESIGGGVLGSADGEGGHSAMAGEGGGALQHERDVAAFKEHQLLLLQRSITMTSSKGSISAPATPRGAVVTRGGPGSVGSGVRRSRRRVTTAGSPLAAALRGKFPSHEGGPDESFASSGGDGGRSGYTNSGWSASPNTSARSPESPAMEQGSSDNQVSPRGWFSMDRSRGSDGAPPSGTLVTPVDGVATDRAVGQVLAQEQLGRERVGGVGEISAVEGEGVNGVEGDGKQLGERQVDDFSFTSPATDKEAGSLWLLHTYLSSLPLGKKPPPPPLLPVDSAESNPDGDAGVNGDAAPLAKSPPSTHQADHEDEHEIQARHESKGMHGSEDMHGSHAMHLHPLEHACPPYSPTHIGSPTGVAALARSIDLSFSTRPRPRSDLGVREPPKLEQGILLSTQDEHPIVSDTDVLASADHPTFTPQAISRGADGSLPTSAAASPGMSRSVQGAAASNTQTPLVTIASGLETPLVAPPTRLNLSLPLPSPPSPQRVGSLSASPPLKGGPASPPLKVMFQDPPSRQDARPAGADARKTSPGAPRPFLSRVFSAAPARSGGGADHGGGDVVSSAVPSSPSARRARMMQRSVSAREPRATSPSISVSPTHARWWQIGSGKRRSLMPAGGGEVSSSGSPEVNSGGRHSHAGTRSRTSSRERSGREGPKSGEASPRDASGEEGEGMVEGDGDRVRSGRWLKRAPNTTFAHVVQSRVLKVKGPEGSISTQDAPLESFLATVMFRLWDVVPLLQRMLGLRRLDVGATLAGWLAARDWGAAILHPAIVMEDDEGGSQPVCRLASPPVALTDPTAMVPLPVHSGVTAASGLGTPPGGVAVFGETSVSMAGESTAGTTTTDAPGSVETGIAAAAPVPWVMPPAVVAAAARPAQLFRTLVRLQAAMRGWHARVRYQRLRAAAIVVQRVWRERHPRKTLPGSAQGEGEPGEGEAGGVPHASNGPSLVYLRSMSGRLRPVSFRRNSSFKPGDMPRTAEEALARTVRVEGGGQGVLYPSANLPPAIETRLKRGLGFFSSLAGRAGGAEDGGEEDSGRRPLRRRRTATSLITGVSRVRAWMQRRKSRALLMSGGAAREGDDSSSSFHEKVRQHMEGMEDAALSASGARMGGFRSRQSSGLRSRRDSGSHSNPGLDTSQSSTRDRSLWKAVAMAASSTGANLAQGGGAYGSSSGHGTWGRMQSSGVVAADSSGYNRADGSSHDQGNSSRGEGSSHGGLVGGGEGSLGGGRSGVRAPAVIDSLGETELLSGISFGLAAHVDDNAPSSPAIAWSRHVAQPYRASGGEGGVGAGGSERRQLGEDGDQGRDGDRAENEGQGKSRDRGKYKQVGKGMEKKKEKKPSEGMGSHPHMSAASRSISAPLASVNSPSAQRVASQRGIAAMRHAGQPVSSGEAPPQAGVSQDEPLPVAGERATLRVSGESCAFSSVTSTGVSSESHGSVADARLMYPSFAGGIARAGHEPAEARDPSGEADAIGSSGLCMTVPMFQWERRSERGDASTGWGGSDRESVDLGGDEAEEPSSPPTPAIARMQGVRFKTPSPPVSPHWVRSPRREGTRVLQTFNVMYEHKTPPGV
eukprot:jgi/Mesvir1/27042/Mv20739-RA.1